MTAAADMLAFLDDSSLDSGSPLRADEEAAVRQNSPARRQDDVDRRSPSNRDAWGRALRDLQARNEAWRPASGSGDLLREQPCASKALAEPATNEAWQIPAPASSRCSTIPGSARALESQHSFGSDANENLRSGAALEAGLCPGCRYSRSESRVDDDMDREREDEQREAQCTELVARCTQLIRCLREREEAYKELSERHERLKALSEAEASAADQGGRAGDSQPEQKRPTSASGCDDAEQTRLPAQGCIGGALMAEAWEECQEHIARLARECFSLQEQCKELRRQCELYEGQCEQLRDECRLHEESSAKLVEDAAEKEGHLREQLQESEERCKQLAQQCLEQEQRLRAQCQMSEDRCKQLAQDCFEKEQRCVQLAQECGQRADQVAQLQHRCSDLERQCVDFALMKECCEKLERERKLTASPPARSPLHLLLPSPESGLLEDCRAEERQLRDLESACEAQARRCMEVASAEAASEARCTALRAELGAGHEAYAKLHAEHEALATRLAAAEFRCTAVETEWLASRPFVSGFDMMSGK
eukprot:gnl/TRDRNA2_/TRDRNA2_83545_c0_seq1.p1 gnl/TRDRNA2_/TRDRNA2_83545_c0~~gnl/TRDRNA2_/TRDRNA2_83545_c0_seq1.p1  ORF type:complete len:536 (+),score=128.37 gnl/TRDRNA2_/TRDRNA2_83545_c0_seq1:97-1704(+)